MITSGINFTNFKIKKKTNLVKKLLFSLLEKKTEVINSLSQNYKNNFDKKILKKYKKVSNYRIIGMGGSTLGSQAIYDFLNHKIKKNFLFIDNLQAHRLRNKKKNLTNLIVSKSGNTIETIVNANILLKKKDKNIFITENKDNYLYNLAQKLKSEIIHHNNYIGGRYSVLSETGMLPAELMGLNEKKFKRFNNLIKNKYFIKNLIENVVLILDHIKKGKTNSVILNYDENSDNLFKWYQQLIAESLGKNGKGIFPIISSMPKDNHSLLQLYLDGPNNNFYTFFSVREKKSQKLNNSILFDKFKILKNKNIYKVLDSQKKATENIFRRKKISFRSFEIINRSEETLGELFCFFILETILLGYLLKVNPFNQPKVELIKNETKKILI